MKILVIGGGAREHAMAWKLASEPGVSVICAPGNPGIEAVARCVPADLEDPAGLLRIAQRESVDLTVVGPELPLSLGVVDLFVADGRPIVGPTRAAAALEWSKSFSKDFMARHGVPTARYHVCGSAADALAVIADAPFGYPLVLKADGLAAGKGVVIAEDRAAAEHAVRAAMVDCRFGAAGSRLVIEEFLHGEEASYFVLSDGQRFVSLSSAQDHKRIFDDDRGPNTGGMGAFAPSPLLGPDVERRVIDEIVGPVLRGMEREGTPFRGFLYVGLMLTAEGPRVVEFNVRFGDPEAQVILPMLDEDLSGLLAAAAAGSLPDRPARLSPTPHVGVVLASGGYPDRADSGRTITGLAAAAAVPGALVFHAGTSRRHGERRGMSGGERRGEPGGQDPGSEPVGKPHDDIVTAGGRVLTVVGSGASYREAMETAYRAAALIHFDGMQMRRDIGRKACGAAATIR